MGIVYDDAVMIKQSEREDEPSILTVNCPDKTGLGCDLCRIILFFGLTVVRIDVSTDGKWCYIVFWVLGKPSTRWGLLKNRLMGACPSFLLANGISYDRPDLHPPKPPDVYLLKFCCYDRRGLLHDVTEVLCELELTIKRVKVSTTPDGKVMDLFFITDSRSCSFAFSISAITIIIIESSFHCRVLSMRIKNVIEQMNISDISQYKELLHTKNRREDTCDHLKAVFGDGIISCDIEMVGPEISSSSQGPSFFSDGITEDMFNVEMLHENEDDSTAFRCPSITMDNLLSPAHTLVQIVCQDHKGLLYDVMRTLKDYNIQVSYGRLTRKGNTECELDLFIMQADGKKIVDPSKQTSLRARLQVELSRPLRLALISRGPDAELLVANPIELSGKGRPMVFHDITLALKILDRPIFSAEIGRYGIGDREWEVYRVLLDEGDSSSASKKEIEETVWRMLMSWE